MMVMMMMMMMMVMMKMMMMINDDVDDDDYDDYDYDDEDICRGSVEVPKGVVACLNGHDLPPLYHLLPQTGTEYLIQNVLINVFY